MQKKSIKNTYISTPIKLIGGAITLLASISAIISIYPNFFPDIKNSYNPKIIGNWKEEYSYPITGGSFIFEGKTQYFKNGKYNTSGQVIINLHPLNTTLSCRYVAQGAGDWIADDNDLLITLTGLGTTPISCNLNGEELSPYAYKNRFGNDIPDLSKDLPPGSSSTYKIKAISTEKIALSGIAPAGSEFSINLYKTP